MAQKTYIVAISTAVNRCWFCGLSEILNLELPAGLPIFGPHFLALPRKSRKGTQLARLLCRAHVPKHSAVAGK